MPVKTPSFSKVESLKSVKVQRYFTWFSTDVEHLFFGRSPRGYIYMNKNRYFVQYNDQRKM